MRGMVMMNNTEVASIDARMKQAKREYNEISEIL